MVLFNNSLLLPLVFLIGFGCWERHYYTNDLYLNFSTIFSTEKFLYSRYFDRHFQSPYNESRKKIHALRRSFSKASQDTESPTIFTRLKFTPESTVFSRLFKNLLSEDDINIQSPQFTYLNEALCSNIMLSEKTYFQHQKICVKSLFEQYFFHYFISYQEIYMKNNFWLQLSMIWCVSDYRLFNLFQRKWELSNCRFKAWIINFYTK